MVVTGGSLTRRLKSPSLSPGRGSLTNEYLNLKPCFPKISDLL